MKKHRISASLLSLALAASLCAPAWAAETPTPEEETALAEKYALEAPVEGTYLVNGQEVFTLPEGADPADYLTVNVEDLMAAGIDPSLLETSLAEESFDGEGFIAQYTADHPEEYAAFDPHAYWQQGYSDGWDSEEEYIQDMIQYGVYADEEDFAKDMWEVCVCSTPEYDAAVAAWQAQRDAERVEAYRAAHPGELEALSTADLLAWEGYIDPMAGYMADNGFATEAEAVQSLLLGYIERRETTARRRAAALAYQQAYPEKWAAFDADAYIAERYWYYDGKEELMEYYDLGDEQELTDFLFTRFVEENQWPDHEGYDPSLVVNGEVRSYDLVIENGVSYTDAATLNDILGTSLTGDKVAIRAAAEGAGWGVTWNPSRSQVVLLDREMLLKGLTAQVTEEELAQAETLGIDVDALLKSQDFTNFDAMMNKVLSAADYDRSKTYQMTETGTITLTAFNSLDGDETVKATVKSETVMKGKVIEQTFTLSAGELVKLLSDETLQAIQAQLPKHSAGDLKTLLTGVQVRIILNGETGEMFLNAPILAKLDRNFTEDTWLRADMGDGLDMTWSVLDSFAAGEWDTAELLYNVLLESSARDEYGAVSAYGSYAGARGMLGALVGGDRVKARNGGYTWTLDAQFIDDMLNTVAGYMGASGIGLELDSLFKEFEITLTVDKNGDQTSDMVLRPDMDAIAGLISQLDDGDGAETAAMTWALNLFDFRMESHAQGTANRSQSTVQLHWKNQFKVEAESQNRRVEAKNGPLETPPETAKIVEF